MASDGDRSDFRSKSFDPAQALASLDVNLPVEDAEEYENLQSFRSAVHKQQCHVERNIPGVSGPGGVPLQRVAAVPIDRNFTPDQGPIRGRGRKRVRNVLTRMDEMQGPLALLRQCRENNIRIKVYTRNHSEIRGILTGYIVAFDKHWNLALRDVDEIFQKKLRCKTPALGNVSNFVSIGDLTIRERGHDTESGSEEEEEKHEMTGMQEQIETNVESQTTGRRSHFQRHSRGREEGAVVGTSTSSSSITTQRELSSSRSSKSRGLAYGKKEDKAVGDKKKREFIGAYTLESLDQRARTSVPISRQHPPLTSEAQDALRLSLSECKHGLQAEASDLQREKEEGGKEVKGKKRIRKRKKREIRKRHVNQLFIRGENVVLINVLDD